VQVGAGSKNQRRQRAVAGLVAGTLAGFVILDLGLPSLVSFWGERSGFVPGVALVAAALWLTPLRRVAALAVGLLVGLWFVVAYTPVTSWMAEGLVRRDPAQAADAVFVFGSRVQLDGDPTTDAMSRLLRGVELVAEGRARYLIVSELRGRHGRYTPLAQDWVGRYAPKAEVLTVGPIKNTRGEAVAVERLFRKRGWTRVLAVTSPTHTRRAAATLEAQGLEVIAVPSVETDYDLELLDRPGDRREAFGGIAHEWIGLFVYAQRGWID
jgi:uncharacterized SAM-binding protein YcdF (DUF218 family)